MAYIKNTWVDQNVERPRTYELQNNTDGSVTFIDSFGNVTELGTPVNADNMNHIEEGIYAGSFTKYDANGVYEMNDLVTVIEDGSPVIYKSLQDDNKGKTLSDTTYWEKISLGGGGGLEIGDIGFTQLAIDESKGKRRVLNGQVIIQDQYVQFTNIVKDSVALNPSLACTEAEWQTAVTMSTHGVCEKFVIDDEAGTIRLPKYPQYLDLTNNTSAKTQTVSVYGNGMTIGLTNGVNNAGLSRTPAASYLDTFQNLYGKPIATVGSGSGVGNGGYGLTTDPTKSGITGSVTVPAVTSEKIKGTYFIQVATGSETEDNIINKIELNNPFSLLDYKFSEYELNNLSWLRSNGQYNSKITHPAVYDLLLKIYNGVETKAGVSVKLSTETFTDYDFVLNTVEETFRLPIKVKQTFFNGINGNFPVVGNGIALGLTDGSTNYGLGNTDIAGSTAKALTPNINAYGNTVGVKDTGGGNTTESTLGITTDPTKSGLVAQVSQSAVSGLYLYFYVGETVQNANLINAGRIEEKLTNYLSKNNKQEIVSWGMPDYTAGIVVANTQVNNVTSITYTAPCDGYIIGGINPNGTQRIYVNDILFAYINEMGAIMFLLNKGDTFKVSNLENSSGYYNVVNFYPLKGAK